MRLHGRGFRRFDLRDQKKQKKQKNSRIKEGRFGQISAKLGGISIFLTFSLLVLYFFPQVPFWASQSYDDSLGL